jgi:hypothetical protein
MNRAQIFDHHLALPPIPNVTPIVFVMDDDISVRESLESLIRVKAGNLRPSSQLKNFSVEHDLWFRAA